MTTDNNTPEATEAVDTTVTQFLSEESHLVSIRAAITSAVVAGEPFDALAAELATLNIAHRETQLVVNASAIVAETAQIKAALETLIGASQLATLMGEPVTSAIYTTEPGTGENGPVSSLILNAKVQRRATTTGTRKSTTGNTAGGSRKTSTYVHPDGTIYTARDFVLGFAPESVLKNSLVTGPDGEVGKWPTKPMFIDQTIAHQAGLGINFTINVPVESEVEPVAAATTTEA